MGFENGGLLLTCAQGGALDLGTVSVHHYTGLGANQFAYQLSLCRIGVNSTRKNFHKRM